MWTDFMWESVGKVQRWVCCAARWFCRGAGDFKQQSLLIAIVWMVWREGEQVWTTGWMKRRSEDECERCWFADGRCPRQPLAAIQADRDILAQGHECVAWLL